MNLEEEIKELGIFPAPPRVLPKWLAKKIKKINGKYVIIT